MCLSPATYQGCYRENRRFRHFTLSPGHYDANNLVPATCQTICGEWKNQYAGTHMKRFFFACKTLHEVSNFADHQHLFDAVVCVLLLQL